MSNSNNTITARGHREAGWKIGHSRRELDVSEAIDVGNGEHPTLPTASPPLQSPSISCFLVDEELEALMETSGSTKVDGQCWVCKRLFVGLRGLRVHLAKTECGVAVNSSTRLLRRCPAQEPVPVQSGNPNAIAVPLPIPSQGLPDSSGNPSCGSVRMRYDVEEETVALQEVEARVPIRWPLMKETAKCML